MNTFGALKYLEAEQTVVEEIMLNLKDQLNKLKIEELAIRASLRARMKNNQANAADLSNMGELNQSLSGDPRSRLPNVDATGTNVLPSTSSNGTDFGGGGTSVQPGKSNMPIEVSINEALEMISRYRQRDPLSQLGDDAFDDFGGESVELEEAELDEAEIYEETEFEEASSSAFNLDAEFLDLRNADPEDDGTL